MTFYEWIRPVLGCRMEPDAGRAKRSILAKVLRSREQCKQTLQDPKPIRNHRKQPLMGNLVCGFFRLILRYFTKFPAKFINNGTVLLARFASV